MIGAPPPGGAPPGAAPKWTRPGEDPGDVWAMDYGKGRWIAPDEDKSSKRGHLAMPPGWSPRDLKQHPWSVVLSPPGTPPPPNTYTYTPSTREINAPGSAPSRDDRDALTLSFMPGGPPPGPPGAGTTTPPPGPVPGGQPGAGPPMPGRPGPGQPPGPGRPPGPPPPPPGGPGMPPPPGPPPGQLPMGSPPPGMPQPGGPPPGMPPPGMPPPPGPPGGSPPGMGGSPSPPMQQPGPLPPGGGMPPRPPAPPPGVGPPMGAPAGPGAGVSPGPMPSGPGAAPPPAPPNPGMAMGQVRPPPPAPRPSPATEHQDPDSMVAALLRALGFEDDAEPSSGEGQDRAPVGTGEDVPEDVTQARQRSVRAAADPWIGTPYHMGGSDQKAIDCSGLVNALLRGFGAHIPAGHGPSTTGWRNGQMATPIPWESIQPGDVLLSPANPRDPQNGEHMALYVGGGQMVEAAGPAGAPVRYSEVTNRNLQPYRMREPVPGLQQVTLMAQNEGGTPSGGQQGAQPGQPPAASPSVQRIAMDALDAHPLPANANAEIADIMAAGALFESGANPNGNSGDGGNSVGLWQLNAAPNALGAGMTEAQRRDPPTAAARMAPEYQRAYQQGQQRGFEGPTLATYTYINAERPANDPANHDMRLATLTGPTAQGFQQKYAEVEAHSQQRQELQIGGGYASPSGAGQQNAGGSPNPLQQVWDASAPLRQQLVAQLSGAGDRVANLGATPAYAEAAPLAGPPPGPSPQVQQPPTGTPTPAPTGTPTPQGQQPPPSPQALPLPGLTGEPGIQAAGQMLRPGVEAAGGVASAVGTAAQNVVGFGNQLAGVNTPPSSPATQPAAAIDQTRTPPTQSPLPNGGGTNAPQPGAQTYGPPQPPSSGLPPDTETEHWDNNIRAWVPKNPPADFGPGGGRYRLPAGVQPATDANGNPASNPHGTPVEYVPNQPGSYPQGYYDGANWHAPTAANQQTQAHAPQVVGDGLSFLPSAPGSMDGTWTYTDPNTHAISRWGGRADDTQLPQGIGQPQQAPQTPLQEAQTAQTRAQTNALQNSQRIPVEVAGQLYDPQTGANLGPAPQTPLQQVQTDTAQRGLNTPVESGGVMYDRYGNALGPPAQSPLAQAQTSQANRSLNTPVESGGVMYDQYGNAIGPPTQSPLAEAQTQRVGLENSAPITVANRVYRPTKNPDTGELSYGEGEPIPLSAEQQANLDEKQREFGTLSAYQQSLADESKASLAQNESQFQQSLSEKQAESARPYQQMTKAEQAQDARAQQELGLKKEQLGFQENESANKLEQLPRGGLTRVNPYTGQIELVNAPEPEAVSAIGGMIYIPGGRDVSIGGHMVSGGPNPYAGVPSGQGAPFRYPGGSGGGQSFGAGGWGGGGMGGGQSGGGYQWQQPRQQQGWG